MAQYGKLTGGKLFAIGTGPGSSDLLTVRAARCLATLDILYAPAASRGGDSLALSIVREYLPEQLVIKERHFPMTHNQQEKEAAWDAVSQEIEVDVESGKQVGFISLGDAMLFSTWVSLLERLQNRVDIEIIPGVTSFACIAAQSQFPLAMEQQSLAIVSCTAAMEEVEQALLSHDSLVLMKVARYFPQVKQLLIKHHLIQHAVLISDVSLPTELISRDISQLDDAKRYSYFTTILVNKNWQA